MKRNLILVLVAVNFGLTLLASSNTFRIAWPPANASFSESTLVKIKVDAGTNVATVRFFANAILFDVSSNGAFNVIWGATAPSLFKPVTLTAIAFGEGGSPIATNSVDVSVYDGGPPQPVVAALSPRNGSIFAAGEPVTVTLEVLASLGDAGPVELYEGPVVFGTFDQKQFAANNVPVSITASNLTVGPHTLSVRYKGGNGSVCDCSRIGIVIAELGFSRVRVLGRQVDLELVTAHTNRETIIQRSIDLRQWTDLVTNTPIASRFNITDTLGFGSSPKVAYRAIVPP